MAIFPDARWRPIWKHRDRITPRIVCVHTMVGSLWGTDSYFRNAGVDSHVGVGNDTDGSYDGVVLQWVDSDEEAYANLDGNDEVFAIETSDGRDPRNPWSPKALDSIVAVIAWACKEHDIPPVLIDGNEPGSTGIAYHRQGCDHSSTYVADGWPYDQWRVPNGVLWSSHLDSWLT